MPKKFTALHRKHVISIDGKPINLDRISPENFEILSSAYARARYLKYDEYRAYQKSKGQKRYIPLKSTTERLERVKKIINDYSNGLTQSEIAKKHGMSRQLVWITLRNHAEQAT